jgi:hypothetical protein
MRKIANLLVLLLATSVSCFAQYDMADAELNASLTTIVEKYKVHFADFKSYVIANYKVTRNRYDYMESGASMRPGDIFLAVEIEKITKKSLTDIIDSFKKNKKNGWASIAKEFGVTPGSPAFESLKDDAYKLANGTARPKPKPVVKAAPATKPAQKSTGTKSSKTKSKTTAKTQTKKPATKK